MSILVSFFQSLTSPNQDFHAYTATHFVPLIIIVFTIWLMHHHRDFLRSINSRIIDLTLFSLLIIPRSGLYIWYLITQADFKVMLPVYICRITILITAYNLLTANSRFRYISYYLGLFGGTLPLLFPDTSGYDFPHINHLSFFFGHGLLLITTFYYLWIHDYRPSLAELKKITLFTFVYFIFTSIINAFLGSNYNYLEKTPPGFNLGGFEGTLTYKFLVLAIFLTMFYLEYIGAKLFYNKRMVEVPSTHR